MSYLARLKAKIGEKLLPHELTELTKGASVSFVSAQGEGFCPKDYSEPARKTAGAQTDRTDTTGGQGLLSVMSVPDVGAFAETDLPEPARDAIEERRAFCAGMPAPYRDTWARLNHQRPLRVSEAEWRRAVDDGGRFLDAWGALAAEWGWTVGELFDLPRDGRRGGLLWFIAGAKVEAFGPDHGSLDDGRIFDRGTIGGERC